MLNSEKIIKNILGNKKKKVKQYFRTLTEYDLDRWFAKKDFSYKKDERYDIFGNLIKNKSIVVFIHSKNSKKKGLIKKSIFKNEYFINKNAERWEVINSDVFGAEHDVEIIGISDSNKGIKLYTNYYDLIKIS